MLPEAQGFINMLNDRDAETVIVSDDAKTLKMGRIQFPLYATVPEWLSPITTIIPGQLFAMYLAHARDFSPDHPRGLRKVTETR
jgi:glucosamine--fructose-6-phosphate aminotransferase (isomerizing)